MRGTKYGCGAAGAIYQSSAGKKYCSWLTLSRCLAILERRRQPDVFSNTSTGSHSTGMLLNTARPVNSVRKVPYRRADVHQ